MMRFLGRLRDRDRDRPPSDRPSVEGFKAWSSRLPFTPFRSPPSAVSEESGSDAPGSLEREADVNEQQYASPGGQAPESMTALFPRMESPVALVLLCLFVLERRIASLEAAIEALSTRVGVPSPSIRSPGTCPSTESGPASSFAAQSQSSVYQAASNDDDMCERSEALLGTNTIESVKSKSLPVSLSPRFSFPSTT
ncbi:hypothetical protein MRX96_035068 [Rhipicephalus microplus]